MTLSGPHLGVMPSVCRSQPESVPTPHLSIRRRPSGAGRTPRTRAQLRPTSIREKLSRIRIFGESRSSMLQGLSSSPNVTSSGSIGSTVPKPERGTR